jgi:glycosyltransferase involved in cell wall biosynthesis
MMSIIKMNIWILQAYDQPGGQSDRSAIFAKYFTKLGCNVSLFTNSYCTFRKYTVKKFKENHYLERQKDGYSTIWLKSFPYLTSLGRLCNMFENMLRILIAARSSEDRPDYIIVPSVPPTTAVAGLILSARFKCKLIYEIRDVWPSALIDGGVINRFNPLSILFRFIEKACYRRADLVVSTLEHTHDHVRWVNPSQRVIVLPNPFDSEELQQENFRRKETHLSSLQIKTHYSVVYIGGFSMDHDVMGIMQAARKLRNKTQIRFKLYGDGTKKLDCENYKQKHGLTNVDFMGVLEKTKIFVVQDQADVLLAAIIDSPTFKFGLNLNKMITYLASGKPIVFSGNQIPTVFTKGFIGFHNRYGDIDQFSDNILKATKMDKLSLAQINEDSKKLLRSEYNAFALSKEYIKSLKQL